MGIQENGAFGIVGRRLRRACPGIDALVVEVGVEQVLYLQFEAFFAAEDVL